MTIHLIVKRQVTEEIEQEDLCCFVCGKLLKTDDGPYIFRSGDEKALVFSCLRCRLKARELISSTRLLHQESGLGIQK